MKILISEKELIEIIRDSISEQMGLGMMAAQSMVVELGFEDGPEGITCDVTYKRE